MDKDLIRTNLITKFVCSVCGSNLLLTYDAPKRPDHIQGEPTGAAVVESIIAIHPCQKCLRPVEDARAAINTLMKL